MAQNEFTDFEVQVDTTDVEAWGGEQRPLVPPGDYLLKVVNLKQDTIGQGTPAITATFEVVSEGPELGKHVYNNYPLTQKAMGRLKALQMACGASLGSFKASEVFGQTILGTVTHTDSAPSVDANGNPRPPRTFANLINERAAEQEPAAPAAAPPITRGAKPPASKPVSPAANGQGQGAPRRA